MTQVPLGVFILWVAATGVSLSKHTGQPLVAGKARNYAWASYARRVEATWYEERR